MGDLVDHWPVAGLVVRTPRLELRWPGDDDLVALAELAAAGIHEPDEMPFGQPWTRAAPGDLERNAIQYNWRTRGEWTPDEWTWNPVVVVETRVVGTQGMDARRFVLRRTVGTGSWLGRPYQGRGIGTEMRAAVLHLAFAGLGAVRAETAAWADNRASLAVTRKLGYRPNGDRLQESEGVVRRELGFVLDREEWQRGRREDIQILGLEPCLASFGAVMTDAAMVSSPPSREG